PAAESAPAAATAPKATPAKAEKTEAPAPTPAPKAAPAPAPKPTPAAPQSTMTFATDFLVNPKLNNTSRRRPGPSLSMFKDMARTVKTPSAG
ncbi:MAG: hypothetical protein O3A14_19480, partial [Cyanobacteria bacterium]|nr:hypothetical protein [Cyanobacteriota bacterium]